MKITNIRLLTSPAVTSTGASLKFIAMYDKAGVRFAHIYVELIVMSEDIKNIEESDARMYLAQLEQHAYNTVEWVELTHEDGTVEKVMAVVCQDSSVLGHDAIKFCETLIADKESHGWYMEEDGTAVDSIAGLKYPVTYVNRFTLALHEEMERLSKTRNMNDAVRHYALMNSIPCFRSMHLPELSKWAVEKRQSGWSQGIKVGRMLEAAALKECGPAVSIKL